MSSLIKRAVASLYYKWVRAPAGGGKPVPASAFDREYHSGNWDHFFGPDERLRYDVIVDLIRRHGRQTKILDVGCGSGRLASLLDPACLEGYLGVDLSTVGLEKARALKLPHVQFAQADFETWTPEPDRFDIIVFNECLGYASDPLQTAQRFARSLPPNGLIIVSLFQSANHLAFWQRLARRFTFVETHVVTNTRNQVWDVRSLRSAPHSSSL